MTTSELLKTIRKRLNLSQDELSQIIFVTTTTISRWENGKSKPSRIACKMLTDYCEAQGIEKELIEALQSNRR